jgi:hypothetical protein
MTLAWLPGYPASGAISIHGETVETLCGSFAAQEGRMTKVTDSQQAPLASNGFQEESTVVEIKLLLEDSLLESLDEFAEEQGIATAPLIRRVLREFLHHSVAGQQKSGAGSKSHDRKPGSG